MAKHILVIDDDITVRTSISLALSDEGYALHFAASGEAGLAIAEKQWVDLIYLDLRMPVLDGVATLRALREQGYAGPIYILTAFHREFLQDLIGAREDLVPFELLQKPLDRNQIIRVTRNILDHGIWSEEAH